MAFRIFIHGLESSNQGTKAVYFRERFPDMVIPHFVGTLEERMEKLLGILSPESDIVLVGSSFGGLMASIFAMENEEKVNRLVLLAPAINLAEFGAYRARKISVPVWTYHGREDEVIPLDEVERVAKQVFPHLSFHAVRDDHYLHRTFKQIDWDTLLRS
jgi:pimeloyl-ACP methyl ester carboxylesterase